MKSIKVTAAVIKSVNNNGEPCIFATQRGYGEYKDWWEFPGGKVETGESSEEALQREIREELDSEIRIEKYLTSVEYDYPSFHLSMDCFWCSLQSGSLTLLEHEASRWLTRENMREVNWLPADICILDEIEKELSKEGRCIN